MTRHAHDFRRFVLVDYPYLGHISAHTIKVFSRNHWSDAWYVGWECRCGQQGYAA